VEAADWGASEKKCRHSGFEDVVDDVSYENETEIEVEVESEREGESESEVVCCWWTRRSGHLVVAA
jgi:hypothetical protein